eukprot:5703986-Prymnesium_polylepis.1
MSAVPKAPNGRSSAVRSAASAAPVGGCEAKPTVAIPTPPMEIGGGESRSMGPMPPVPMGPMPP